MLHHSFQMFRCRRLTHWFLGAFHGKLCTLSTVGILYLWQLHPTKRASKTMRVFAMFAIRGLKYVHMSYDWIKRSITWSSFAVTLHRSKIPRPPSCTITPTPQLFCTQHLAHTALFQIWIPLLCTWWRKERFEFSRRHHYPCLLSLCNLRKHHHLLALWLPLHMPIAAKWETSFWGMLWSKRDRTIFLAITNCALHQLWCSTRSAYYICLEQFKQLNPTTYE